MKFNTEYLLRASVRRKWSQNEKVRWLLGVPQKKLGDHLPYPIVLGRNSPERRGIVCHESTVTVLKPSKLKTNQRFINSWKNKNSSKTRKKIVVVC